MKVTPSEHMAKAIDLAKQGKFEAAGLVMRRWAKGSAHEEVGVKVWAAKLRRAFS